MFYQRFVYFLSSWYRNQPEGVVNLESEDGSFTKACKCNSAIDVRHLIWSHLDAYEEEEEIIKLQSPRVNDSYVGFDAPLHACGIRDGDTVKFKIIQLPPKEDNWIIDELGRMRDSYKSWPELPKVVILEKAPKRPMLLVEDTFIPKKVREEYVRFNKEAERKAKAGETATRPKTPPCKKGEGARR